ncbi:S9 family peptidase [Brevibacillus fluminis]|uniref:S9 family peptidase n=1 Tax=Brevibacillus fluminis TaxID=511487 RepID=A0A3M8CSV7_9BACL|nr:S9 family peptidase [Brevibacillus fluminis]RNB78773.1 S9 family peptidase [Brevibacillus fluminis]
MSVTKRLVTAEDLYQFQWPSRPTLSPNGNHVIYEKTIVREREDDYETQLFLADVDGKGSRVLTTSGNTNRGPVWAPDSNEIAFVSDREYGTQAWLLSLAGGEAVRLTRFRYGIHSLFWSPDGQYLYGLVLVASGREVELIDSGLSSKAWQEELERENRTWANGPKRYDWSYYKLDGSGLQKGLQPQLVAIHLASGDWRQLTRGSYAVCEPAISPDGAYVAFTANRDRDGVSLYGGQIFRVSTSGGEPELLFNRTEAQLPTYSPDGKWIAFFADIEHKALYRMGSDGGEVISLSAAYPFSFGDATFTDMRYIRYPLAPQWSHDSSAVYALSTRAGRNEVVRFATSNDGSAPKVVVDGDRTIFHFSYDGDNRLALAYSTATHPGMIAVTSGDGEEVRLDDCNDELMAQLVVAQPEEFSYTSEDGWGIQGFLLKPTQMEPGQKYPVLLDIHGGPHSMFGYAYFHQMQLFAANGFAVVYLNPRGSSGFGKPFFEAVHGDYGGKDHLDLQNGLAEAIRRYPFLDERRIAVNGISYGGFMVNWLLTKTDAFFAAVSEGCISNWISMFGTSDICPAFMEQEFAGQTDVETLWRHSPLAHVSRVKTPLLLIHAEQDLRCPMEQAEQFYTHIKRQGGDVEFLRIPNASHGLLQIGKPALRVARLQAMVGFIAERLPQR